MKHCLRRLAAPILALCLAAPLQAQGLSLGQISAYLNGLTSATADFTQISDDGTITTGKLFILRPGRARFEYAPPEATLVMAGGGQVAIFDPKSNEPPQQYALNQTPLSLILDRNVDLTRKNMVTAVQSDQTSTTVVAQDPEHPDYGSMSMVFTANPIELRQWVITDSVGAQTTVILGALKPGGAEDSTLYNISYEMHRRGF
jgi:outer membrane lipoprotein-sorting protein